MHDKQRKGACRPAQAANSSRTARNRAWKSGGAAGDEHSVWARVVGKDAERAAERAKQLPAVLECTEHRDALHPDWLARRAAADA
ncbi:hypothetical protein [Streptomyces sp. NPDC058424]|uniref:hypothetical protein n=1 Tax=Streptomyces sp. NPDC058424 TaxID=3346491 RepID=UPI003663B8AA